MGERYREGRQRYRKIERLAGVEIGGRQSDRKIERLAGGGYRGETERQKDRETGGR